MSAVTEAELDELWASKEWIETGFEQHQWMKANREEMNELSPTRWFVINGTQWPLVCISVYQNYPGHPTGIRIAVSVKDHPDAWFENCNLPPILVLVLVKMLNGDVP